MNKIAKYLNQLIIGNVFDAPEVLDAFSTDHSVLKIKPKYVAFPESTDDVKKLLCFLNEISRKNIPISATARGAGLGEGGACLSNNIIISTEKLNKLLEIDTRERLVRVQAGITLKELNTALSVSGLTIPIAGHENETIGGIISTCPTDNYAEKYGGIYNYVDRIEAVLANGECLQTFRFKKYNFAKKTAEDSLEGSIYQKMAKITKEQETLIKSIGLDNHRTSGYPMIAKVIEHESIDLKPLFFGAEGTLGIITEVILKAEPIKKKPLRVVVTSRDLDKIINFTNLVKRFRPREMNLYDLNIVQEARETGKNLDGVIKKLEDGFVVFLSFDEFQGTVQKKMMNLKNLQNSGLRIILESDRDSIGISELENSLAIYLNRVKNGERPPVLTSFYLPNFNLARFLKDMEIVRTKLGVELSIFGSCANSIYNFRPKFDMTDPNINKKITAFLRAGAFIINRHGGTLDGGESAGRLKSIIANDELLKPEIDLYKEIKSIFDKNNILNPGVKMDPDSRFVLTHFRSEPVSKIKI